MRSSDTSCISWALALPPISVHLQPPPARLSRHLSPGHRLFFSTLFGTYTTQIAPILPQRGCFSATATAAPSLIQTLRLVLVSALTDTTFHDNYDNVQLHTTGTPSISAVLCCPTKSALGGPQSTRLAESLILQSTVGHGDAATYGSSDQLQANTRRQRGGGS